MTLVRDGIAAALLGSALWGLACGSSSPADVYAGDPVALARGRSIFMGSCGAYCHGLHPGKRDAPFLFDCVWKHGDEDEDHFRVIHGGVEGTRMVGFGGRLPEGDDDIWRVVAFLRSRSLCD